MAERKGSGALGDMRNVAPWLLVSGLKGYCSSPP